MVGGGKMWLMQEIQPPFSFLHKETNYGEESTRGFRSVLLRISVSTYLVVRTYKTKPPITLTL